MNFTNNQIAEKLRNRGMTPTTQRIAILKELLSRTDHPGAETLYKKLKSEYPSLSMNTIYLNLDNFVSHGVVQRINTIENLGRFDGNPDPHHHFICVKCKKIIDLHDLELPEIKLNGNDMIARLFIDQVHLNGICADCI